MFEDRIDAGLKLAKALEKYQGRDVIVLGIPRGGVVPAFYVAKHLDGELSILIARKLGYPFNPEAAFGALAEDGSTYFTEYAFEDLDEENIQRIINREQAEIEKRVRELRNGEPLPALKGKTVILVDDGIATGATIFAGINLCKNQGAGEIVVAAPVSGGDIDSQIREMVNEVVVLEHPRFYMGVSQGYRHFGNITNYEARQYLEKCQQEKKQKTT